MHARLQMPQSTIQPNDTMRAYQMLLRIMSGSSCQCSVLKARWSRESHSQALNFASTQSWISRWNSLRPSSILKAQSRSIPLSCLTLNTRGKKKAITKRPSSPHASRKEAAVTITLERRLSSTERSWPSWGTTSSGLAVILKMKVARQSSGSNTNLSLRWTFLHHPCVNESHKTMKVRCTLPTTKSHHLPLFSTFRNVSTSLNEI